MIDYNMLFAGITASSAALGTALLYWRDLGRKDMIVEFELHTAPDANYLAATLRVSNKGDYTIVVEKLSALPGWLITSSPQRDEVGGCRDAPDLATTSQEDIIEQRISPAAAWIYRFWLLPSSGASWREYVSYHRSLKAISLHTRLNRMPIKHTRAWLKIKLNEINAHNSR